MLEVREEWKSEEVQCSEKDDFYFKDPVLQLTVGLWGVSVLAAFRTDGKTVEARGEAGEYNAEIKGPDSDFSQVMVFPVGRMENEEKGGGGSSSENPH